MTLAIGLVLLLASLQGAPPAGSDPAANILRQLGIESLDDVEGALGHAVDPESVDALAALARYHARSGRHEHAATLFREALRMRRELVGIGDERGLYFASQVSSALGRAGRFAQAVEFGEACLSELAGSDDLDAKHYATFLNNHAVNLQAVGEPGEAVECQRQALGRIEEYAGVESADFALCAGNLANLLGDLGLRREAFALAQQSLRVRGVLFGEDSPEYARALTTLGVLHLHAGELGPAEVCLRRSESILRREDPPDASSLGGLLHQLGSLCFAKGEVAAAIAAYRESCLLYGAALGADHPVLAMVEVGLGFALLHDARDGEALEQLERARASLHRTFGAANESSIQASCGLALAHAAAGRLEEAAELMGELVEQAAALGVAAPHLEPSLRAHLASCLEDAGDLAGAEAELRAALAIFERVYGVNSSFGAQPRARLARLVAERGDLVAAETEALRALEVAGLHRAGVVGDELAHALYAGRLGLRELAGLVAGLRVARGDAEGAFAVLEQERSRRDLPPTAPAVTPESEQALQAEERARARLRTLEARLEARRADGEPATEAEVAELAAARNELSAASTAAARSVGPLAPPAPVADTRALRATLREGELVLSLSWSDLHVAWIAVAAGDPQERAASGLCARGRDEVAVLARGVERLAAALATDPRQRSGPLPELPAALVELAQRIGARGARRVWIVTDGPLGSLPPERWFDGLAHGGPHVALLPSATARLGRVRGGATARPARSVVLGDPHFAGSGVALVRSGRELQRLPATRAEASYVAGCLERDGAEVVLLLGEEATRAKLEEHSTGIGILHLATHGFPGTTRAPYDAALALAGAAQESADEWADALTLDRLLRRWGGRLASCELVVLSACETSRQVQVGTGVYSLATGFLRAGAGSVLATLWRVDEVATALLMGRFAENLTGTRSDLAQGGPRLSPGEALREAQRWLRDASRDDVRAASSRMGLAGDEDGTRSAGAAPAEPIDPASLRPYSDPYFWSGFVLIG